MKSVWKYFLFSALLILIDQCIKIWVHHNMEPGYAGQINVFGEFFKLHYVLNRGMAFGLEIPLVNGKIYLTVFRLIAMVMIGIYLNYLYQKKYHEGLLWCVAAILGGAIGNLIDSIFYGIAFGNAPFDALTPWFHGQVIDMFFVDIYEGVLPSWIPLIGGSWYSTPIFNFADACIFCGVVTILIFQYSFFKEPNEEELISSNLNDQGIVSSGVQISEEKNGNIESLNNEQEIVTSDISEEEKNRNIESLNNEQEIVTSNISQEERNGNIESLNNEQEIVSSYSEEEKNENIDSLNNEQEMVSSDILNEKNSEQKTATIETTEIVSEIKSKNLGFNSSENI